MVSGSRFRDLACRIGGASIGGVEAGIRQAVAAGELSPDQAQQLINGAREMYARNCTPTTAQAMQQGFTSGMPAPAPAAAPGNDCGCGCGGNTGGCASAATMTVNCLYRQPDITDCQAETIKDDETEGQIDILGAARPAEPETYVFDVPSPRMSAQICLNALQLFSNADPSVDLTSFVTRVTVRGVYQGQTADGVPVLLLARKASASGAKLVVNNGRCECRDVCGCQTAFHVLQVTVTIGPGAGVPPASVRLLMDFTRTWAEDCGQACFECGIPLRCNQPIYEAAPPVP